MIGLFPGPEVIKTFFMLNSSKHETYPADKYFYLLINVKMPTVFGILIFISRINITSEIFKARKLYFHHFIFYEQLKLHAQLS